MARNIVVIGSGPAAVWAAIEAKKTAAAATVTLVADEGCEPYEKPPLSKAVLLGKAAIEDAPIAGPAGVAAMGVEVRGHTRAEAIDPAARTVTTNRGTLPYDALVLATGSQVRELALLPQVMPRVHYLRTETDARALKGALAGCRQIVVVGGGLIGLEVAASAVELGIQVTVLEAADRIMGRACDAGTSAAILAEHRHRGVEVHTGVRIVGATPQLDGDIAIETAGGDLFVANLVVVGAGVTPEASLAAAAGLPTGDGIMVDEQCRTGDPAIFAAGDCTRFPGPDGALVRLENWRHAQEHGAVAGRNAAGASETYRPTPSYWSEQYDLYIQGVGWPLAEPDARVMRPLQGKSRLTMEIRDGMLAYAVGINAQRDLAAIRRLIERKIPVDAAALADPAQPFQAMLKAKA